MMTPIPTMTKTMEQEAVKKYSVAIKKLPKSQIEISATIPAEEFDSTRPQALKNLGKGIEVPGFRKGHAPEKILVAKIGDAAIYEEMAKIAIGRVYPLIIVEEKLDPIGHPEIQIKKIAVGNPMEFTLITAVFPEFSLPDYKKYAAKEMRKEDIVEVTDEEIEKAIDQLRQMRANHAHTEEEGMHEEHTDNELPLLDDDFLRSLGAFENVEDFKNKLRENMLAEKQREARDKKRVAIMEAIIENTKIDLPDIIVEQEINHMEDEFAHNIENAGMTFEAYLKAIQKTREELRNDWNEDAQKRAKAQIITGSIAKEEKIVPDQDKLDKEVAAVSTRYPDTDKERVMSFISMLLTNEKVFDFLESQK